MATERKFIDKMCLSLSDDVTPVCMVTCFLLHAAEGVLFPVQPVSQERVEDMSV